jgi:hypothetical protein
LLQVDGISDDDIWAVGDSGTVLHFDGGTWSQVDCPFHRTIRDVWAAGPDDVYAITMDWPSEESSLIHFDGARWTTLEELDGASCLWAHSPDEIYMATRDGRVLVRRLGHIEELVDGCGTYLGINGSPSGYVVAVGWGGIVRIGHGKVDFFKCSATQPLYDAYVEEDGSAIVAGAFSAVLRIPAG